MSGFHIDELDGAGLLFVLSRLGLRVMHLEGEVERLRNELDGMTDALREERERAEALENDLGRCKEEYMALQDDYEVMRMEGQGEPAFGTGG